MNEVIKAWQDLTREAYHAGHFLDYWKRTYDFWPAWRDEAGLREYLAASEDRGDPPPDESER